MARCKLTTDEIVNQVLDYYESNNAEVTTSGIKSWCDSVGYSHFSILNKLADYKSGRGKFTLQRLQDVAQLEETYEKSPSVSLIPEVDDNFVPFGNFKDIKEIIKSGVFYPAFITGLSGNGKTHSVEQACATLKRECVRINITIETDEDDLIGGFRLVNGDTVFHYGPVVEALKRGSILLLDEVDLASNKVMCLQSLLEGKGVYLKKTNEYIKPAPGFNVIATANTKGRGDDSGMFIGTNILNEAFLERFAVTFEQDYPTPAVETKILARVLASLGKSDYVQTEVVSQLVTWAEIIRKTYDDGGVDSVITTRRLINICKAFVIWGNLRKAVMLCINRFDDDTKTVFAQLFEKLIAPNNETNETTDSESPTF